MCLIFQGHSRRQVQDIVTQLWSGHSIGEHPTNMDGDNGDQACNPIL